jgi:hypothetical protein
MQGLKSVIEGLPSGGRAEFKDGPAEQAEFCLLFAEALQAHPPGKCMFENIDLSNGLWQAADWATLMDVLREQAVTTRRLKAFKCGLGDEAIRLVIGWMEVMPPERLPQEIHLSHNQMSEGCFLELLDIIERKRTDATERGPPIWLRAEGNKVSGAFLNRLTAEGRACLAPRIMAPERLANRVAAVAMPSFPEKEARVPQCSVPGLLERPSHPLGKELATRPTPPLAMVGGQMQMAIGGRVLVAQVKSGQAKVKAGQAKAL